MNAPLPVEGLDVDKLGQMLEDLQQRVVVQGPGNVTLGARNIYTDPALFELELEHIIEGGWVYALHESQIPNAKRTPQRKNSLWGVFSCKQLIIMLNLGYNNVKNCHSELDSESN